MMMMKMMMFPLPLNNNQSNNKLLNNKLNRPLLNKQENKRIMKFMYVVFHLMQLKMTSRLSSLNAVKSTASIS